MKLRRIALDGFRNYTDFTADFSPGVNVIWGENAQGKTNLLEAIGFLSGARSHRARGTRSCSPSTETGGPSPPRSPAGAGTFCWRSSSSGVPGGGCSSTT